MKITDSDLLDSARESAYAGMLNVVAISALDPSLKTFLTRRFEEIVEAIDDHRRNAAMPVTPESLGLVLIDAPESAVGLAAFLLDRYDIKERDSGT